MNLNGHELVATTVKDLIRLRASLGDKPLAIVDGDRLTYGEADERANRIATALQGLGVQKGDVVATYMYNSTDHIALWFGCAKLGAIWAPLNIALVNVDLARTLNDAGPRVVVVDGELHEQYERARPDLRIDGLVEVVRGDAAPEGWLSFDALLAAEAREPDVRIDPADPAGLIYTGGTTGLPKGVLVSNLWYFPGCLRYQEMLRPTSDDIHLGLGQMCHTIGSAVDVLAPVYHGMTTVTTRWFSASRFWDVVREHRPTLSVLIGPILIALLNQPSRPDDRDNTIRLAGTGTGQMPREIVERFMERFDIDLLELYGQTETGPLGCVSERLDDRPHPSLGTPNGWAEVMVADEHDRPCPPGVVGEILLRPVHPHTFLLGYWNNADRYAEACRNLWFHSGDLGHQDEDGYLHFEGRLAHSIRRGGESIAAAEVEQALLLHPAVAECGVVGVPGELGDEEVKAYIQLQGGADADPLDIVKFCEERIAYFKVPRYIEFVDDLPRSAAKNDIERYKLKALGVGEAWDSRAAGYAVRRRA